MLRQLELEAAPGRQPVVPGLDELHRCPTYASPDPIRGGEDVGVAHRSSDGLDQVVAEGPGDLADPGVVVRACTGEPATVMAVTLLRARAFCKRSYIEDPDLLLEHLVQHLRAADEA